MLSSERKAEPVELVARAIAKSLCQQDYVSEWSPPSPDWDMKWPYVDQGEVDFAALALAAIEAMPEEACEEQIAENANCSDAPPKLISGDEEWRDIASAPKDGTRVLLWARTDITPEDIAYVRDVCELGHVIGAQIGYWCCDRHQWDKELIGEPTHWRPLPSPPSPRS